MITEKSASWLSYVEFGDQLRKHLVYIGKEWVPARKGKVNNARTGLDYELWDGTRGFAKHDDWMFADSFAAQQLKGLKR